MALKDYFYFTKSERRGVVALLVIIAILFAVRVVMNEDYVAAEPANSPPAPTSTKYRKYLKRSEQDLELNSADTLQLQDLKGIGPGFARRIVAYRDKLGGYYAKEQLMEVYGFTDKLYNLVKDHITVDATKIQKLKVNELTIAELKRHPYISYYEAKAIVDYRSSLPSQKIENISELSHLQDLKENWELIKIYIE